MIYERAKVLAAYKEAVGKTGDHEEACRTVAMKFGITDDLVSQVAAEQTQEVTS